MIYLQVFLLFLIWDCQFFLGKHIGIFSHFLPRVWYSEIFVSETCEPRIVISRCYLTHSWGWERRYEIIPFPRVLVRKWKQQTNRKSEPGPSISLNAYTSITQVAHFRSANMCVYLPVCRHVHALDYKSMREYVCVFLHLMIWISGCVCSGRGCRKLK